MVSGLSIFFMAVGLLMSVVLPTAVAIFVFIKCKSSWKAFFTGAVVFVVSQPVLRLPLLNYLGYTTWFTLLASTNVVLHSLILGVSAGIFEEIGRFIGIKLMLKNRLQWKNGLMFGLGHGGVEALIFSGMSYLTTLGNSLLINSGKFDSTAALSGASKQLSDQIKSSLINTAPAYFLLGGVERVLAVILHVSMTMMVLYAVKSRKLKYLLYAVLFHALLDSPLGILKEAGIGIWAIEGFIAVLAAVSVLITIRLRTKINSLPHEDCTFEGMSKQS